MKTKLSKVCLAILFTITSISSKAEVITAIANRASWNESSTWDLDRLPMNGDIIYIPSGIEIKVDENVNFEKYGFSADAVQLIVSGIISFKNGKSLNLSENSTLKINKSGKISKSGLDKKLSSFISIHLIKIWNGKEGNISGPMLLGRELNSSQELTDFEILNSRDTFLISWKIKQFNEAGYYELLVSKNGKNWESIKKMKAFDKDSTEKMLCHIHKCSKTDRNLYFRLDACDLNGQTTILATAKAKRKMGYSESLTAIPKMLIGSTVLVFARNLKLSNLKW